MLSHCKEVVILSVSGTSRILLTWRISSLLWSLANKGVVRVHLAGIEPLFNFYPVLIELFFDSFVLSVMVFLFAEESSGLRNFFSFPFPRLTNDSSFRIF